MEQKVTSVSSFLDKRRESKDGKFYVRLILYYGRKSSLLSFSKKLTVSEDDWNKINSKRLKNETLMNIRSFINDEVSKAEKIIKQLGDDFSLDLFKDLFYGRKEPKNQQGSNFYKLFQRYIDQLKQDERLGNWNAYKCAFASFKKFSPTLLMKDITPDFLEKYEKWMLDNGSSITTVGIYLRSFRTILNIAIDVEKVFPRDKYPFGDKKDRKYTIPKGNNIKKGIVVDDLKALKNVPCKRIQGQFYRDLWFFSFYCCGMNMVDIFMLKYSQIDGNFLYFFRRKTTRTQKDKTPIQIPLTKHAFDIIEKWGNTDKNPNNYVFNIFNDDMTEEEKFKIKGYKIKSINKCMKRLASRTNLSANLTSYVARHSWATVSKNHGVSVEEISENLGHTNIKTTKDYLDSFPKEHKIKTSELISNLID